MPESKKFVRQKKLEIAIKRRLVFWLLLRRPMEFDEKIGQPKKIFTFSCMTQVKVFNVYDCFFLIRTWYNVSYNDNFLEQCLTLQSWYSRKIQMCWMKPKTWLKRAANFKDSIIILFRNQFSICIRRYIWKHTHYMLLFLAKIWWLGCMRIWVYAEQD